MNQDPNDNTAFSENTNATQTNPFTGDLKGEFTSDFGTNTNAVSSMFKGDNMGGNDKKRTIMLAIGGGIIVLLAAALIFLEDDQGFEEDFVNESQLEQEEGEELGDDTLAEEEGDDALESEDGDEADTTEGSTEEGLAEDGDDASAVADDTAPGESEATAGDESMETMEASDAASDLGGTGSIQVSAPFDGASLAYDETQGPATFSWNGAADRIVFSRSSSMSPIVRSRNVAGRQSYRFLHPHPGTWYWRLENAEDGTAVQSFTIMAPIRRNFPVTQPQSGGQISGNGGVVAWQGDSKVARYMVQLVPQGTSWATPQHQFGTSGTSIALQGVEGGSYDMRVGAFSEVAGRWEWQVISGVSVE